MMKTYTELMSIDNFEDRLRYLSLDGTVGSDTFGFDRYLNQSLYRSKEWKSIRNKVILRDNGCDLADPDRPIGNKILIHHMNPVTKVDILEKSEELFNPEYLICVSHQTHNCIHYGYEENTRTGFAERKANDMIPWRE